MEDGELLQEIRNGMDRERSNQADEKTKKREELRRNLEQGTLAARQ